MDTLEAVVQYILNGVGVVVGIVLFLLVVWAMGRGPLEQELRDEQWAVWQREEIDEDQFDSPVKYD